MGKASSAKKVARAARAGGRGTAGPKRQWGYPVAIAAIVVVGVLLIAFARGTNETASAESPAVGDHIHNAYGIYVCDTFLPPLTDQIQDTTGLHTHGGGLIHIHPFNSGASGKKATLAKWGETTGITFSSDGFTVDGTEYTNGYDCNGQPATVSLYVWSADDLAAGPQIYTGADIGKFRLDTNRNVLTLAVVPEGTDVPVPDSTTALDNIDPVTDNVATTVPATDSTTDPTAESTTTTAAP
jgi:hypothetical protein